MASAHGRSVRPANGMRAACQGDRLGTLALGSVALVLVLASCAHGRAARYGHLASIHVEGTVSHAQGTPA